MDIINLRNENLLLIENEMKKYIDNLNDNTLENKPIQENIKILMRQVIENNEDSQKIIDLTNKEIEKSNKSISLNKEYLKDLKENLDEKNKIGLTNEYRKELSLERNNDTMKKSIVFIISSVLLLVASILLLFL